MSTQVRIRAHGIGHPIHPGRAGAADRNDLPSRQLWRRAGPIPPVGPPPSELRRAIPHRAPGPFGPGGSHCRSGKFGRGTGRPPGGGCKRALERTVLLKGGLQSPTRPTRPRGSTTAGRGRIDAPGRWLRQTGDASWIANEADPGGGMRSLARPARRLSTIHAAKGAPGDRPGAANEPWKERSFQGRLAAPRAVQGSRPFANGLAPRSPVTRARVSSKAAAPAESQGKAADWRCIRARFPVRNQIIP